MKTSAIVQDANNEINNELRQFWEFENLGIMNDATAVEVDELMKDKIKLHGARYHRRRLVFSPGGAQKHSCSSQRIVRAEGVKVMFLCVFLYCFFLFEHGRRKSKKKLNDFDTCYLLIINF